MPLKASDDNRKVVDNYVKEVINEVKAKLVKCLHRRTRYLHKLRYECPKQLYDIVNDQYVAFPDDKMQVASTVIDVASGQVRAQIGGRHIPDDAIRKQFAVNTQRDVGSTVKPIMDYGPAIENYSTGRLMVDKPTKYPGTDIDVFNSDLTYQGVHYAPCDYGSRNTTAVQTFDEVGKENIAFQD